MDTWPFIRGVGLQLICWGYSQGFPVVYRAKRRDEVPQKLKQFANIADRFWVQKRSKFELGLIDTLTFDQSVSR